MFYHIIWFVKLLREPKLMKKTNKSLQRFLLKTQELRNYFSRNRSQPNLKTSPPASTPTSVAEAKENLVDGVVSTRAVSDPLPPLASQPGLQKSAGFFLKIIENRRNRTGPHLKTTKNIVHCFKISKKIKISKIYVKN
jgi:hypothetical protein